MAYNPDGLSLVFGGLSGGGLNMWCYDSEDSQADVNTDNYITDADEKGMQEGDLILIRTWTTWNSQYDRSGNTATNLAVVQAIGSDGTTDLTDGVSLVTDTD